MSVFIGICTDPEQMRPVGDEPIGVSSLAWKQQQAINYPYHDIRNFYIMSSDDLPLDMRFADFKRRLADAVARNERRKGR